MTFKEKLMIEHPEKVDDEQMGECKGCPSNYGYISVEEEAKFCMNHSCDECWNREIPTEDCMTIQRAIEMLKIERECANRNNQPFGQNCDRNCGKCDLVQNTDELIEMYDFVIEKLKEQK